MGSVNPKTAAKFLERQTFDRHVAQRVDPVGAAEVIRSISRPPSDGSTPHPPARHW